MVCALAVGLNATAYASAGASPLPAATGSPSPVATASPYSSPEATASELPTPTPTPSASAGFDCSAAYANTEDFQVVRGATIWVQVRGYQANTEVSISFVSVIEAFERPIGAATTDAHGDSDVPVAVPADAPFGDAFVRVTGTEGCTSDADVVVAPSVQAISIDDATVVRGQRVIIEASGFAPGEWVALYLDGDPGDALCRCRPLANDRTSAEGSVVLIARIPRDISLGRHFLVAYGPAVDEFSDLSLWVRITVFRAGTLPPTDMEPSEK
jgi:hypothetical protein